MGVYTSDEQGKPSTPSAGNRTLYPKSDGWYDLNSADVESKVFGDNVFGQNHQNVENTSSSTNGSTTFQTHNSLTVTGSIGHKVRLGFMASWNMSTAGRNIKIQATVAGNVLGQLEMETKDSGADIRNWNSGFFYYTFVAGGTVSVTLDFAPENGSDTATLYYSSLECWRVS